MPGPRAPRQPKSVPCRVARGLPSSSHGVAYQAASKAARQYRAVHSDPSDKASGRPSQWIHEIKHDGYRLIARKRDGPGASFHAQSIGTVEGLAQDQKPCGAWHAAVPGGTVSGEPPDFII